MALTQVLGSIKILNHKLNPHTQAHEELLLQGSVKLAHFANIKKKQL